MNSVNSTVSTVSTVSTASEASEVSEVSEVSEATAATAASADSLVPACTLPISNVRNCVYNEMVTNGALLTAACAAAGIYSAARGSTTGVVVSALGVAAGSAIVLVGNSEQRARREPIENLYQTIIEMGKERAARDASSSREEASASSEEEFSMSPKSSK